MGGLSVTKKVLIIAYLLVIHLLAVLYIRSLFEKGHRLEGSNMGSVIGSSTESSQLRPSDSLRAEASPRQLASAVTGDPGKLIIPVAGIKRSELQDTYTQSRSGGREHDAIDIMAPGGAPVIATADGEIAKFFDSKQDGITIYQWSAGRTRIYYYAHLQKRADGLQEGAFVKRGTIIGYVGDTGNAGTGNFHLHFSIIIPTKPDRYWDGTNVNPYPLLKEGIEVPAGQ